MLHLKKVILRSPFDEHSQNADNELTKRVVFPIRVGKIKFSIISENFALTGDTKQSGRIDI